MNCSRCQEHRCFSELREEKDGLVTEGEADISFDVFEPAVCPAWGRRRRSRHRHAMTHKEERNSQATSAAQRRPSYQTDNCFLSRKVLPGSSRTRKIWPAISRPE